MSKKKNTRKDRFLNSIPTASLESDSNLFADKCKMNFSYFDDSQDHASSFSDLTHEQLARLFNKLKNYTENSLNYWAHQRVGGGGNRVFTIYGSFPPKSNFSHPKHVPHQAEWARFRLEGDMRLVGFVVPDDFHDSICPHCGARFDKNTFYVVFIDLRHNFYLSKLKS